MNDLTQIGYCLMGMGLLILDIILTNELAKWLNKKFNSPIELFIGFMAIQFFLGGLFLIAR